MATKVKRHVKSNHPPGCSDTVMQDLWREHVRHNWNGKCVLVLWGGCKGALECHHVKKRRLLHLRHSPANGILLCKYHHDLSGLRLWRDRIENIVGKERMEWLDMMEQKLLPDYLASVGKTRREYLRDQKALLEGLLEGNGCEKARL